VPGKTFPPLLDQIMDRALSKRAEDRFASAADFASAMQLVLQGATQLPPHLAGPRANELPTQRFQPMAGQAHAAAVAPVQTPMQAPSPHSQPAMRQNGPAMAMNVAAQPAVPQKTQRLPPAAMQAPLPVAAGVPRTNVGLLVAVALAFLLLGVGLAVVLMKFVVR
jgi:serine/threonine-protein kinase